MIYLKKFDNYAAYEAAKSSLILPNVSLTVDNNAVHYNPSTPPTPSHEYVDLGLPSGAKWATMNVGANSVTDYGNHYRYGRGAATYQETSGDSRYSGTENPLAASADTAVQAWGGQWHMPTQAQFLELMSNTTYEWTTIDGVNGGKFTATNGNYVFFPAAGSFTNDYYHYEGRMGSYWTSTPNGNGVYYFFCTADDWDVFTGEDSDYESIGSSVRPIMDA